MAEYTKEQLMGALKKADAAGDTRAAKAIARKLNAMRGPQEPVAEQPEPVEQPMSELESAKEGFISGATAGFSDELLAATETGKQVISDMAGSLMKQGLMGITDAMPEITESYERNLKIEREEIDRARKDNPTSFMVGDSVGTAASIAASFGLGRFLFGAKAMTTKGMLATHGSVGFVHGIGRTEDDTIAGMTAEGAVSAGAALAGEAILPGLGKVGKVVGKAVKTKIMPDRFVKYLGGNLDDMTDVQVSKLSKVLDYADEKGEPVVRLFDTRKKMAARVDAARAAEGKKIGEILDKVDNTVIDMDIQGMHDEIYEKTIAPLLETGDPDVIDRAKSSAKFLKRIFFETAEEVSTDPKTGAPLAKTVFKNKNLTLKKLHAIKARIHNETANVYREGSNSLIQKHKIKQNIAFELKNHIDDAIDTADKVLDKQSKEAFKKASSNYGPLAEVNDVLYTSLKQDKGKNFITEAFNDGMNRYIAVGGYLGSRNGVPVDDVALALVGLRELNKSKLFNGVVVKSSKVIGDAFQKNPERYAGIASSLVASASISGEDFIDKLGVTAAKVDLMEQPLQRSSQEVLRRKSSILTLISSKNKQLGDRLRTAIQKKDVGAIQQLMSLASQTSKLGMIQPGLGWDGRAVTPQDTQAVNNWLQTVKSSKKRMMLTTKFNKDNMIPQEMMMPEQPEPMEQFIYRKRKNKVENPEL